MFLQGITEIMARAAQLFEAMRSAAMTEKEIAGLMQNLLKEHLDYMTIFLKHLANNCPANP